MSLFYNQEGYLDLTAGKAIAKAARKEKKKKKQHRPMVYICCQYSGDVEKNIEATVRYCRFAVKQNAIPVAPHLMYPRFLDDSVRHEHELGVSFAKALLRKCDEVWVFSDGVFSCGMMDEYQYAIRNGKPTRRFTTDCQETGGAKDGRV